MFNDSNIFYKSFSILSRTIFLLRPVSEEKVNLVLLIVIVSVYGSSVGELCDPTGGSGHAECDSPVFYRRYVQPYGVFP